MKRASLFHRLLAFLIDLGWIVSAGLVAVLVWNAPPFPSLETFLKFFAILAPLWATQLTMLRGTLGQRAVSLRALDANGEPFSDIETPLAILRWKAKTWQLRPMTMTRLFRAGGILALSWMIAGGLGLRTLNSQPSLRLAVPWEIPPFTPAEDPAFQHHWIRIPLYYTLGTWPKTFRGKPVFFVLPYRKGPPRQFPGEVQARWEMPGTRLTIEGPKTPENAPPLAALRTCFLGESAPLGALPRGLECLKIRRQVLERHFSEMGRDLGSRSHGTWKLRWFHVANPALPESERPQGIYVSSTHGERAQERYILITAQGTQQALILSRPETLEGREAGDELQRIVGGLRVLDELNTGRAWIGDQIAQTRLDDLRLMKDSLSFVKRLAEIQALLISHISVEPDNVNAYYHLGGLSLMLLKHAVELRTQRTQIISTQALLMIDEWTAAVEPMIQATLSYVKDINPRHPNVSRLENILVEAQKL